MAFIWNDEYTKFFNPNENWDKKEFALVRKLFVETNAASSGKGIDEYEITELTEDILRDLFEKYGPIESLELFENEHDKEKKYAHIQYYDNIDAYLAYLDRQRVQQPHFSPQLTVRPIETWLQPEPLQSESNTAETSQQEKLIFNFENCHDFQSNSRMTAGKMRNLLLAAGEHLKEVELRFNESSQPTYPDIIFKQLSIVPNLRSLIVKHIQLQKYHLQGLKPVFNQLENFEILVSEPSNYKYQNLDDIFHKLLEGDIELKTLFIEALPLNEAIIMDLVREATELVEFRMRKCLFHFNEKVILEIVNARKRFDPPSTTVLTLIVDEFNNTDLQKVLEDPEVKDFVAVKTFDEIDEQA